VNGKWSTVNAVPVFVFSPGAGVPVAAGEYYIDTDPGHGSGVPLPISAGLSVETGFLFDPAGHGPGMHFLAVRARDAAGRWSTTGFYPFVNLPENPDKAITSMEYYIDQDPGYGSATPVPLASGTTVSTVFTPDLLSLAGGLHHLCLRARDQAGSWSVVQQYVFYHESTAIHPVTAMEYFIDTDPGFGLGNNVAVTASHAVTAQFVPDTAGLQPVEHQLLIRVKDAGGNWSTVQHASFNPGSTSRTWTGAVSDDWNLAGNWSPAGVPGWNDDVLIPATAPFMPVVRNPGLSCRNVVVTPGGGELHIAPGHVLTVNGNIHLE